MRSIGVREHGLVAVRWTEEVVLVAERGGRGVVAGGYVLRERGKTLSLIEVRMVQVVEEISGQPGSKEAQVSQENVTAI